MVKIKGGAGLDFMNIITIAIRYGVLLILLGISIHYINEVNTQFIIFIVLLIIIILGFAVFIKDISELNTFLNIIKVQPSSEGVSIDKTNPVFLQFFMYTIGAGVIMKIISLTFFIIVLNYGRSELKQSDSGITKRISSYNSNIINHYIKYFTISIMLIISLAILTFIIYGTPETQIMLKNMSGIIVSLGILGLVSLEMYYSVQFLKVKKDNGLLYEITNPSIKK